MENDQGDISNKTIVVLVLLTVLITVLSTLVVMNEVQNVREQSDADHPTTAQSEGKVTFTLNEPKEHLTGQATGQVVLALK
jgi:hypothetical protein